MTDERPTPETDAAKCKFTSLFGDDEDAYWVPLKLARRLERERDAERALADRLAEQLESLAWLAGHERPNTAEQAIAVWKEARSEA